MNSRCEHESDLYMATREHRSEACHHCAAGASMIPVVILQRQSTPESCNEACRQCSAGTNMIPINAGPPKSAALRLASTVLQVPT